MLSGSRDYNLHVYDFNGMKSDMKGFRTLQPFEGHPVLGLSWSPTGGTSSMKRICTLLTGIAGRRGLPCCL